MEFTISQIGSATSHWVARPAAPASGAVRPLPAAAAQPAQIVPATAVASLRDMETEYDQFGRFGPSAPEPAGRASAGMEHRPTINATKNMRSGNTTPHELEQEYRRSLVDTYSGAGASGERRFVPSAMTEYQVYQLEDYQYRWAIETERRALQRTEEGLSFRQDARGRLTSTII